MLFFVTCSWPPPWTPCSLDSCRYRPARRCDFHLWSLSGFRSALKRIATASFVCVWIVHEVKPKETFVGICFLFYVFYRLNCVVSCFSTRYPNWLTGFASRSRHTEDVKNGTCVLSNLVLGVDGWVQGNGSRAMLPVTRHQWIHQQCNVHCESSRAARGATKRRWAS